MLAQMLVLCTDLKSKSILNFITPIPIAELTQDRS